MTSWDASKPKICEMQKCGNYENLRALAKNAEFAINSAIAESQNPGGTALLWIAVVFTVLFTPVVLGFCLLASWNSTDVSMWELVVILQDEIWLFQLTRQNYTTDGWGTADRPLVLVSQGSLEILHGKRSVKNTHGNIICLLRCLPFLMTNSLHGHTKCNKNDTLWS